MAVAFVTWLWGKKYSHFDVAKLFAGVKRNTRLEHRCILVTDRKEVPSISGVEITPILDADLMDRGCFCRLRLFDPEWQRSLGLDGKIVSLDLDLLITGSVDPLFERPEDFLILRGVNAVNPNPFNCSLMMLRAGKYPEIWTDFSKDKINEIAYHEFPDDQGWIWHKLPDASGWTAGSSSGVYGFKKPGWPVLSHNEMPSDARIIAFIGHRKPVQFVSIPWVRNNWRTGT